MGAPSATELASISRVSAIAQFTFSAENITALSGQFANADVAAKAMNDSLTASIKSLGGLTSQLPGFGQATEKAGFSLSHLISAADILKDGCSMVIEKAKEMSAETDAAWKEAGTQAQGFFGNLAIGYGLKEAPTISSVANANQIASTAVQQNMAFAARYAEQATHSATPVERAQMGIRDEENEYTRRMAVYAEHHEATARIGEALSKYDNTLDYGEIKHPELLAAAYKLAFGKEPDPKAEQLDIDTAVRTQLTKQRVDDKAENNKLQTLHNHIRSEIPQKVVTEYLHEYAKDVNLKELAHDDDALWRRRALEQMQKEQVMPESERGQVIQATEKGRAKEETPSPVKPDAQSVGHKEEPTGVGGRLGGGDNLQANAAYSNPAPGEPCGEKTEILIEQLHATQSMLETMLDIKQALAPRGGGGVPQAGGINRVGHS